MMNRVDVAVLPAEASSMEADLFVAIDVLRATTTIAAFLAAGGRDLVVADSEAVARRLAAEGGRLLMGEIGGLPPEGFDQGNSPIEAAAAAARGRGGVLFTTNGTATICGLARRGAVATGALANLSAVAEYAAAYDRVVLVCAGDSGGRRFSLEDFATAGVIVRKLTREHPGAEIGDAAGVALDLPQYENLIAPSLPQQTAPSRRWMAASEHGQRLLKLGLARDVHHAAQEDTARVVPVVSEYGEGWARLVAGQT